MPNLETTSGGIFYEVCGQGPALVLLRGLGRTVRHWLGYEQALAKQAGVQVIAIDLRGMGGSTVPARWRHSLFANADDVIKVLDHLKIAKAHVMGVSLGGMVTLALGIKYPARCSSLVVMNTSIAGQRVLRLSPRAVVTMVQAVRFRDQRFHAGLVSILVSPDCPSATKAKITQQYIAIAKDEGLYIWTVMKQLVAAARFLVKKDLQEMRVPTLVVYGTDDQFVPNANSERLAEILPCARLQAIAGAGHEISLDRPEELSQAVAEWLQS